MLLHLQAFLQEYWPHFVFLFTFAAAATAATHAAMNKTDVRAAIGWVGIILLSPLFGAFFYLIAGINRVRHDQISQQRDKSLRDYTTLDDTPIADVTPYSAPQFASLQTLGDGVSSFPLCDGNYIQLLCGGDETYPAMIEAIEGAKVSVALQTYIFDNDREGRKIAAFALSEPEAGSDVAALATTVRPDGNDHVRIDGSKTWISNGGIADFYVVFARSGEAPGARGLSAYVVDADTPGLTVAERIEVIAPHPLATLNFEHVRIPAANRLGGPGDGFKVAMATLDIFRSTVGAAALGFARRALSDMIERANTRHLFGAPLGHLQMTQAAIADSETEVDASALLVYRAAWTKDNGAPRVTREAAIAKMFATEAAQRVIDRAVQLYGGLGVTKGVRVEELYREIRALRIYEGATEVQKIVIGREALKRQPPATALTPERKGREQP